MPPRTIPRSEHPISRKNIDPDALKVLYRLYRSGHTAYLVGGGVRDLLLRRKPKDYDVVTSGRPSQIKKLFRNCRLIGRRFRLAHIHFAGGKLIEVSTFRRDPQDEGSDDLLVRNDNTFGGPMEDALRRDFTINGLFYDVGDFSLIDYVGGVDDLKRGVVRTIRDPWLRFQEDPIRMIRAVKFASRLGFRIEKNTWEALVESRAAVEKSPQPRVHEEIARLLEEGSAARSLELLDESGLLEYLEPNLEAYLRLAERGKIASDRDGRLLYRLLEAVDRMRAEGRHLTRPTLFSACTYPLLVSEGLYESESPDLLVREGVVRMLHRLGLSKKDTERVQQVLLAQRKLRPRKRRRTFPRSFQSKSYFAESFALYEAVVRSTGEGKRELEEWKARLDEKDLQPPSPHAEPDDDEAPMERQKLRRRRRRRRGGGTV
ncbi:MAG: polynucleotide adenylyltransferase PcnB [Armatimonadetes bacterium]|nr:polynucleotide adenylyltransferase PcnB [Armatimonadota bacterium]